MLVGQGPGLADAGSVADKSTCERTTLEVIAAYCEHLLEELIPLSSPYQQALTLP